MLRRKRNQPGGEFPVWTPEGGFTGEWSWQPFQHSPRFSTGYPGLEKDLAGRTLAQVYHENRRGRPECQWGAYRPAQHMGPYGECNPDVYLREWCEPRGHTPHPASIDRDHDHHAKPVKRERLSQVEADRLDAYWTGGEAARDAASLPADPPPAPVPAKPDPCAITAPASPVIQSGRKGRDMTMTPDMLLAVGKALHGEFWRDPLAMALNVNERTMRRWEKGKYTMPEGVQAMVADLIRERQGELQRLLEEIGEVRHVPRPPPAHLNRRPPEGA